MPRVLIIGVGIGGLAAAVAFRRRGWDAAVYEAAPEFRPVGKGIWVPINALATTRGHSFRFPLSHRMCLLRYFSAVMISAWSLSCSGGGTTNIVFHSSAAKVADGLYVVAQRSDANLHKESGVTTIDFADSHIGHVPDRRLFSHFVVTFTNGDGTEVLPMAFHRQTLEPGKRYVIPLPYGNDPFWFYVGTDDGYKACLAQLKHKLGDYEIDFSP